MPQPNEEYILDLLRDVGLVTRRQIEQARANLNGEKSVVDVLVRQGKRNTLGPAGANYGCPTRCRSSSSGRLVIPHNLSVPLNGHLINPAPLPRVRGEEASCCRKAPG